MKILYLVHQFFPEGYYGTEKFILNTVKMVQKNGNKVKVITYSLHNPDTFPTADAEILSKEYVYEGVPVLAFRHRNVPPDSHVHLQDEQVFAFAQTILARENPDLVHVGHPMRVAGFVQACMKLNIPYIVTITDFYLQCVRGIMLRPNQLLCEGPEEGRACETHCHIPGVRERLAAARSIMASARFLLAPSEFVAAMLQKEFQIPVQVIHHGMSYRKIKRNHRVYGHNDTITFFYGGSLTSHKGVHLIIEAAKQIDSNRMRIKIYGTGDPGYTEHIHRMAAADSRIEFCGKYTENDLSEIYQQVDAAIVPSIWYENYPLTLHEALASGIPALVSNVGGMAEKIKDGYNGYTFRLGDANALAARMKQLVSDPSLLNHFKANLSNFMIPTIEQEIYSYSRIYSSIV
ncbi:glycosyltransferase family 4 protein [Paenibacillus beijingensis]|uniref:Glycosyl transferase family 1 n=1 Tax=Paenibacillus beijingensis TaxID=1126833 RepID=A0A0D5NN35_9BACL|nr:glycosyltransferase family 4 protein [Paenibacillus beijingensis]AJY76709.1 hypothetical protein VN24_21720 [Paenibacillus beijingensis]